MLKSIKEALTKSRKRNSRHRKETARHRILFETLEDRRLLAGTPSSSDMLAADLVLQRAQDQIPVPGSNIAEVFGGLAETPPPNLGLTQSCSTLHPLGAIPALHSKKYGSVSTAIYLDFNGHEEASFGLSDVTEVIKTRAYDIDGDRSTFCDVELDNIKQIWRGVAEAFAPFNVNVSTSQEYDDDRHFNQGVLRIVFGGDGAWYTDLPGNANSGGVAMNGSYTNRDLANTVFVWANQDWVTYQSDTGVHEAGHAFGLGHQGSFYPPKTYRTHNEATGIGPFMGSSAHGKIPRWSNGYASGYLRDQLDLETMVARNPFDYRQDDHPDNTSLASTSIYYVPFASTSREGIIERAGDVDSFVFKAASTRVQVDVDVAPFRAMLDVQFSVEDLSGNVLGSFPLPFGFPGQSTSVVVDVIPGWQHVVRVSSTGGYGNLGQYTVSVKHLPEAQIEPIAALAVGQTRRLQGATGFPHNYDSNFTFRWDLDNDNQYGETGTSAKNGNELGARPTFDARGLADGTLHPIRLKVIRSGEESFASTRIRIDNGLLYTSSTVGLPQLSNAAIAWADVDGDGDDDVAISGVDFNGNPVTEIYRNDSGSLIAMSAGLMPTQAGELGWADYDNDGDPDLLVTGGASPGAELYLNQNGIFVAVTTELLELSHSSAAWGDYDNDGDFDLLTSGLNTSAQRATVLYRNNDGVLVADGGIDLVGVSDGSLAWADYDGDGDLDVLLTGMGDSGPVTKVYRNDGATFADTGVALPGVSDGTAEWGDYDNDGDPDIVLVGASAAGALGHVYRNQNGNFYLQSTSLPQIENGSAAWGDHDNDGDLDILVSGQRSDGSEVTKIYRNQAGSFEAYGADLIGLRSSDVSWADVDGDRDLDILVAGAISVLGTDFPSTVLYRTNLDVANSRPSTPRELTAEFMSDGTAVLQWQDAFDNNTSSLGLQYNLRVGTTPGGSEIMATLPGILGNVGNNTSWTLSGLQPGEIHFWSVEAIDPSGSTSQSVEVAFVNLFEPNASYSVAGISNGDSAWGDYDNDGLPDVLVIGDTTAGRSTRLLRNTGSGLAEVVTGIPNMKSGAVAWGDYDRDGRLDILISGDSDSGPLTQIYRNAVAGFELSTSLDAAADGDVAWADFDNDGDLDVTIAGRTADGTIITKIYENQNTTFVDSGIQLSGVADGEIAWADFDGDGWLDIVVSGRSNDRVRTEVYRNTGGDLELFARLDRFRDSSVAWSDYDHDGDLDLTVAGMLDYSGASTLPYSLIYTNVGDYFRRDSAQTRLYDGSANTVDIDNDGDRDLVLSGWSSDLIPTTAFHVNVRGSLTPLATGIAQTALGSIEWADYDGDGDLDAFVTGIDATTQRVAGVYENFTPTANQQPTAPTNLLATAETSSSVQLRWDAGSDAETPDVALTYALRVGTSPGASDIAVPLSTGASRQVAAPGTIRTSCWGADYLRLE